MASNGQSPAGFTFDAGVAEPQLPVLPNGVRMVDMVETTNALLQAAKVAAENAASSAISQEHADYATAALKFVQAVTALDPARLQGGDTPDARRASVPEPPPVKDGDGDGEIGS